MKKILTLFKSGFSLLLLVASIQMKTQTLSFTVNNQNQCYTTNLVTPTIIVTNTVSGATSYSWSALTTTFAGYNPTITTNPGGQSGIISLYTTAGNVTLTLYAINGSSTLSSVSQVVNTTSTSPVYATASPSAGCAGTSFTVTSSGNAGTSYTTTGPGFGPQSGSVVVITPTVSGYYTINATALSGCTLSGGVNISITSPPNVTVAPSVNLCSGYQTNIMASGASSYSWSNGSTLTTLYVTPSVSTCYTVSGSSPGCPGTSTAVTCVNVIASPTISITGPSSVCPGSTNSYSASGGTSSSYTWISTSYSALGSGTSISVPASAGCFLAYGTTTGSCPPTSQTFCPVSPTISVSSNPSSGCLGTNFTLTSNGSSGNTYTTTGPGYGPQTGSNIVITPTASGIYTVTATTLSGCTISNTINLTINSPVNVTVAPNVNLCSGGYQTNITASGATSYTWSNGSTLTTLYVTPTVSTCYTVTGSIAGCIGTSTAVTCVNVIASPTISIAGPSVVCPGSSNSYTASGGASSNYTWISTSYTALGIGSSISIPASAGCFLAFGTSTNGCNPLSYTFCTVSPTLSVSGPTSVCLGSSATFTANGASNYTWSTNANTSTVNVIPGNYTVYNVIGLHSINGNTCTSSATVGIIGDTTCVDVWPGDANRDGQVTSTDVLELGLAANNTGPSRVGGSNTWVSQNASAWVGNVSSGWNKAHADCNGDGTVNQGDTLAIFNNFSLTHAFKSTSSSAADADISIVADQNTAFVGQWNKANVVLGSTASPMSQLYGAVFDVVVDPTYLEPNSYYLVYTSSFLNQNNQNIEFRKPDFSANKIYAATVRTDHADVSGDGIIAELWYKVKSDATENDVINISLVNAGKINNTGVNTSLTSGSAAISVSADVTGIKENNSLSLGVTVFPNPAKDLVYLRSPSSSAINYVVTDLLGKVVLKGEFTKTSSLNTSHLSAGTYIIQFNSGTVNTYKKLVIEE